MRRQGPAPPPAESRKASTPVAATAALGPVAGCRPEIPLFPHRARNGAGMPAGCLRSAGAERHRSIRGAPRTTDRGNHHPAALAFRKVTPVRIRSPVPLRGRLPLGRAPGCRPGTGLDAAQRTPGPRGTARTPGRRGHRRNRNGAATACTGPPGPWDGRSRRPAATPRPTQHRRGGRAAARDGTAGGFTATGHAGPAAGPSVGPGRSGPR
ncbi:hypothetical protein PJL18_03254 [Paenarthrobacter nicotinovorans]|nr:hypothetical protein [Paenarthrobacter nicotinovorans]